MFLQHRLYAGMEDKIFIFCVINIRQVVKINGFIYILFLFIMIILIVYFRCLMIFRNNEIVINTICFTWYKCYLFHLLTPVKHGKLSVLLPFKFINECVSEVYIIDNILVTFIYYSLNTYLNLFECNFYLIMDANRIDY